MPFSKPVNTNHSLQKDLIRLAWSKAAVRPKSGIKGQRKIFTLGALLKELQNRFARLLEEPKPISLLTHRPILARPIPLPGTFEPPRYFSKGALETDRKKNLPPISYLLIETKEVAKARPVPGNSLLLRSLCKGKGVLKQNNQGLVFLDIDNRFISTLLPYLKAYGLIRPPYFNLFTSPAGAHIPVFLPREVAFHYLHKIPEIDREFTFEIEGLYSVEPTFWHGVEEVWFFKIHSPELERLRKKYFLTEKPNGHPFSIAVAVKERQSSPTPLPIMRINTAYLAA